MLPELTKGALDRIMAGEEIEEPIFQFLGYKKLVGSTGDERYRILVSDGIKTNSFTMLAPQLNELITKDVLSERSIVQIERYAISLVKHNDTQRCVIIILNINILVPGHEVGKVLGVDEARAEEAGSNAPHQANYGPSPQKRKILPELTKGALDRIMTGEKVEEPIFQLLGYKRLVSSNSDKRGDGRYRLLVSDGVKSSSFTMLATKLGELITNNVLTEYSIFQLKRYAITIVKNGDHQRHCMVILNIDVLVPGHEVGKVLGDLCIRVDNTRAVANGGSCSNASPPTNCRSSRGQ